MRTARTQETRSFDIAIAILVLGSLWGFAEVVLSNAIRSAGLPHRAAVLTGIGTALMAVAAAHKRPLMLPGIAFVAVLCKQLVVPILHVSVMCKANSCVAVMLEGLVLAGAVAAVGVVLHRGRLARIASAAGAALLAAMAFHFVGMRVAPCPYLLTFDHPGGLAAFLAAEGVPWAIASGLLFPVGYWLGERLEMTNLTVGGARPRWYYAASAGVIAVCWLASAFAIAAASQS